MIEKIFDRAANADMIIGRPKNNHIPSLDPVFQLGVTRQGMRHIGIVQCQRFLLEIEDIDRAAGSLELSRYMLNDSARYRISMQAAYHGEDVQCFRHSGIVT